MTEINTAEDAKTEQTGGDSSHPNVDPEHFDKDRDNLIDTVEIDDDVGQMDLSMGGARQSEQKTDKVDESDSKTDDKDASDKDDKTDIDKTDKVETTADDKAKTDTDDSEDDKAKAERYDQDPAWQRILKERNALEAENKKLKAERDTDEGKDFIDLSTKTEEEIAEWVEDDPAGFAENQRKQIKYELRQEMNAEKQEEETQSKLDKTFNTYSSDNPDNDDGTGFVQMWESGKIQAFMQDNPGHTAISAHMMLTEENRSKSIEQQIKEGIEKGVATVKEKLVKENKARIRTDGLDSGPSYTPGDEDDELKDTKKQGGLISVLAARSARRKQQAG